MNSTVILAINNEQNVIPSITSVLEGKTKPTNFCIAVNKAVNDNTRGVINSFLKSCCDGSTYTEEHQKDYILAKKTGTDINIFSIISDEPVFYSYKYIQDKTDIFFTMSGRTRYHEDYIAKVLSKFDNITGLVYSDFISNGKRVYLESTNPTNINIGNITEVAFSKRILDEPPKFFNCPILTTTAYQKGLVRNIPEALYSV